MNAFNTSWNLCLNKPYLNGGMLDIFGGSMFSLADRAGYENSSRVYGDKG